MSPLGRSALKDEYGIMERRKNQALQLTTLGLLNEIFVKSVWKKRWTNSIIHCLQASSTSVITLCLAPFVHKMSVNQIKITWHIILSDSICQPICLIIDL